MRRKYLVLLLIPLLIAFAGCGRKKRYVAPPPAPSAPSNLSGTAVSSTQIDLSWKDNSTNEKGFYLYRRTTNSYARVAILEVNANSYNDTGLDPETGYWYKVRAYNDGGESGSSNEVNITTPAGPVPSPPELEAPTDLSTTVVSYKQINLSWRDNSDTEDGFRVRCNIGHTRTKTIATVGRNTTRYEHCKLQPMTHHKYYIEAFRGEETAGSPQVSATTPCPVTAICEMVWPLSETLVEVSMGLNSEANEVCRVEAIVSVTDWPFPGDLVGSTKETFESVAFGWNWFYVEVPIVGDSIKYYASIEITDVEIEY